MKTKIEPKSDGLIPSVPTWEKDRILFEKFKIKFKELARWIEDTFIGKFNRKSIDDVILITDISKEKKRYSITIYTDNHYYAIHFRPSIKDKGYLGGYMGTRKKRAGENHTRGNDIADGKYNKETWDNIIRDIFSNELIKLGEQ